MKNIELRATPPSINVPMLRHHSTDGTPRYGYRGSGPADTALSILAFMLPLGVPIPATAQTTQQLHVSGDEPVRLWDGTQVNPLAWALHQPFKDTFLAPLIEDENHTLSGEVLQEWVNGQLGLEEGTLAGINALHLQGILTAPFGQQLGAVWQTLLETLYSPLQDETNASVRAVIKAALKAEDRPELQDFMIDPLGVLERTELSVQEHDEMRDFVVRGQGLHRGQFEAYRSAWDSQGRATDVKLLGRRFTLEDACWLLGN